MNIDLSKCLDDLENIAWGPPTFDSHLVITCHRLRKKPLRDFTIEDLRIMLLQGISPAYLLPIALDRLTVDPMAEGDHYAGDLLNAVLKGIPKSFWSANEDVARDLVCILDQAQNSLSQIDEGDAQAFREIVARNASRICCIRDAASHTPEAQGQ